MTEPKHCYSCDNIGICAFRKEFYKIFESHSSQFKEGTNTRFWQVIADNCGYFRIDRETKEQDVPRSNPNTKVYLTEMGKIVAAGEYALRKKEQEEDDANH